MSQITNGRAAKIGAKIILAISQAMEGKEQPTNIVDRLFPTTHEKEAFVATMTDLAEEVNLFRILGIGLLIKDADYVKRLPDMIGENDDQLDKDLEEFDRRF